MARYALVCALVLVHSFAFVLSEEAAPEPIAEPTPEPSAEPEPKPEPSSTMEAALLSSTPGAPSVANDIMMANPSAPSATEITPTRIPKMEEKIASNQPPLTHAVAPNAEPEPTAAEKNPSASPQETAKKTGKNFASSTVASTFLVGAVSFLVLC